MLKGLRTYFKRYSLLVSTCGLAATRCISILIEVTQ